MKSSYRNALGLGGLGLAALLAAAPVTAFADVKAGVDAWSRGDYIQAVREWTPAAEAGDPDAQFNLGQAYRLGRGVKPDSVRATALYAKAAAQGHERAADTLGVVLFQEGQRAAALPYLGPAAVRGDARAQYLLGVATFNGDGVGRDWPRGYALVALAKAAGLAPAEAALKEMEAHLSAADRAEAQRLMSEYASAMPSESRPVLPVAKPVLTARKPAPPVATTTPPVEKPITGAAQRPATDGPWKLQLGAFSVTGNADKLWSRVAGQPPLAGTSRVDRTSGKLTVLLAGGFATRDAAAAACKALTAQGTNCLVTR